MIIRLAATAAILVMMNMAPMAQSAPNKMGTAARLIPTVPADAMTVTNYYKQSVYDPSNNKVGDILDLMVDKNGRITIAMVGVGGFLGIDEKNVAIPFGALTVSQKGNQRHLTLNTTKDALKSAPGQLPEIAFPLSFYLWTAIFTQATWCHAKNVPRLHTRCIGAVVLFCGASV
jgi:sporulation protein YlmC with PRC-barrel domain